MVTLTTPGGGDPKTWPWHGPHGKLTRTTQARIWLGRRRPPWRRRRSCSKIRIRTTQQSFCPMPRSSSPLQTLSRANIQTQSAMPMISISTYMHAAFCELICQWLWTLLNLSAIDPGVATMMSWLGLLLGSTRQPLSRHIWTGQNITTRTSGAREKYSLGMKSPWEPLFSLHSWPIKRGTRLKWMDFVTKWGPARPNLLRACSSSMSGEPFAILQMPLSFVYRYIHRQRTFQCVSNIPDRLQYRRVLSIPNC